MFWLVSLPLQDDSLDGTWRALQKVTGKGDYSQNYRFELPMSLRVGSLDKLMTLSDDLARVDVVVAGVVNKIRRQVGELSPEEPLTVNSRPVSAYLTNFTWDEARYPLRKPLNELVEELNDNVLGVDDDLKVRAAYMATAITHYGVVPCVEAVCCVQLMRLPVYCAHVALSADCHWPHCRSK